MVELSKDEFLSSIVSKYTHKLGTLKTISGASVHQNNEFTLFTHHQLQAQGVKVNKDYEGLRLAVLELFLSVKIRNDEEIDQYNEELFKLEKIELESFDGFQLVDMVKDSIEKLMSMQEQGNNTQ